MKNSRYSTLRKYLNYGLIGMLGSVSVGATAGGFQLFEENASQLGNAYAGTAASAEDASTEFYNPAGMTLLQYPELTVSGTAIKLNVDSNVSSATNTNSLGGQGSSIPTPVVKTTSVTGVSDSQVGGWSFIPSAHFVYPWQKFAFGFGVTSPYGLATDYPGDSMARFLATNSKLVLINLSPSIAYQLTPKFSVGVGFDAQHLQANLNQQVSVIGNIPSFDVYEASLFNNGSDWGYGWNAGALYQFTPSTRVGFAYRSKVSHNLTGDAELNAANVPLIGNQMVGNQTGTVTTSVDMPASADLSLYHDFNPKWTVLAGIDYTQWSSIDSITLVYSGAIQNYLQQASLPLNFKDTLRYSLGADYHATPKLTLKTGVAFDESPVRSADSRTFRLPDSNRIWVALGTEYQVAKNLTVDVGYAHLFVRDSDIDQTLTTSGTINAQNSLPYTVVNNAIGNFNSSVNEFGLQLSWKFV